MIYLLKTANKRFRVFIAHNAADFRNGNPGIKKQGHSMVHLNISYKGNETNTGFFTDEFGAVGNGVVKFPGNFLQRYGSVVIVDVAQNTKSAAGGLNSLVCEYGGIGVAPEQLGKENGNQIVQKTPTVAVVNNGLMIDFQKHFLYLLLSQKP